jgi:molybdopterin/thiamine biosynthesis adenylyltransferase
MALEPGEFGDEQLLRYSRHILLNELGIEAQRRFNAAQVLIAGAGGLGCPTALYLAAAGVGRLLIADPDQIEITNLQRQILYQTRDVGAAKVRSARDHLHDLNPETRVDVIEARLAGDALEEAVSQVDLVVDCTDNFSTRHALNRACVAHARPLVSGAASRFDGQISVFDLRLASAPCYACLFPESTEPDQEDCATMGVFAPVTGIIGTMQAAEALKCLAGLPGTLNGRLLLLDALTMSWQSIGIERDPDCLVCRAPR